MTRSIIVPLVAATALAAAAGPAAAFTQLQGCFVATSDCAATPRIAGGPGGTSLKAGESYRLLGANKEPASHYQVRVGEPPRDLWVGAACGRVEEGAASCGAGETAGGGGTSAGTGGTAGSGPGPVAGSTDNLLVASWEPTFCEAHAGKPECGSIHGTPAASSFSLHGLWPQPDGKFYCGVGRQEKAADKASQWDRLPPVELDDATTADLAAAMPGTQSQLERHEWIKHGTCFGAESADAYFDTAVRLLRELNEGPVGELFAANVGGRVTISQLRDAYEQAFGPGAGARADMRCDKKGRIEELWLPLSGEIGGATTLGELLKNAPRAQPKCTVGTVDPA